MPGGGGRNPNREHPLRIGFHFHDRDRCTAMKQFKRNIDKDGAGQVTLSCDEAEDMWHVYNLVRIGDTVRCTTVRKVTTESNTGSTSSQRVHTVLSISIENVNFDPVACVLHLKGRNVAENEHVKMGQYHTLDIDVGKKFQLWKPYWDSIDLDRLKLALDPSATADVAAIVMHEGLANLCLLTSAMTIVKAKIDMQIPRKRKGFSNQHDKGMQRFYEAIASAFVRHVDLKVVKCVLIASRGFLSEQFLNYLMDYADKHGNKLILENRSKFLLSHASSGFKHALKEVLSDPAVAAALSDTKAQAEVKALNTFYDLMAVDPARAFYGYKHVMSANEHLAIETLLLSDSLFRSNDILVRKKYVDLAESVKAQMSSRWTNRERVLILCSRGASCRTRHLMKDFRNLMPHSKSDNKMDKRRSLVLINEIAEIANCSKCLYFESRKHTDLYLWISNMTDGPCAKFLVHNVHTMDELRMSGNCLKGSRPVLSFDCAFDQEPHLSLIKHLLIQTFSTPNHHPRSKPFVDHVFTFSLTPDGKIWFRNFQIIDETVELQEIGPRLVLEIIRIFDGSFEGSVLYDNPNYVSPNMARSEFKKKQSNKYITKKMAEKSHKVKLAEQTTVKMPDPVGEIFDTRRTFVNPQAKEIKRTIEKKRKKKRSKDKMGESQIAS